MEPLLDEAACGFVAFNDEGEIRLVNRTLATLLGITPAELVGRKFESILAVAGRIFYHTHFFPILKLQGRAEELYLTLQTSTGQIVPVLVNAVRRVRDGEPVTECIIVRMTQRAQFEDDLLRAKRAAEAASDAKAKFLSMMSHELRAPLQVVVGYAQLLLEGKDAVLESGQKRAMKAIQSATQDVVRLLNDILEFARLENQSQKPYLIDARTSEVLDRVEPLIKPKLDEAGLSYERIGCGNDRAVLADVDRLQQVLLNLLTNAIKFTGRDGKVTIECGGDERNTSITVRDTGCGIPEDDLKRIFEPFFQIDRERVQRRERGIGLGLAISRDLLTAMEGTLTASSKVNVGSEFTVTLPAGTPASPS